MIISVVFTDFIHETQEVHLLLNILIILVGFMKENEYLWMNHSFEVDLVIDPFHKTIFKWFMNWIDLFFVYNSLDSIMLQQLTVTRISFVHQCTLLLYFDGVLQSLCGKEWPI